MKIDEELKQRLNPWDWLVLVVAVVSLLLVLLETFLRIPANMLPLLHDIDRLSCLVFLADIVVRWRCERWSIEVWRWGWISTTYWSSDWYDICWNSPVALMTRRALLPLRSASKPDTGVPKSLTS